MHTIQDVSAAGLYETGVLTEFDIESNSRARIWRQQPHSIVFWRCSGSNGLTFTPELRTVVPHVHCGTTTRTAIAKEVTTVSLQALAQREKELEL